MRNHYWVVGYILCLCLLLAGISSITTTPEVKLKETDHFYCDINGYADHHGPVDVQFLIGRGDKRILVIKTEVDSWDHAEAMCTSWNRIEEEK